MRTHLPLLAVAGLVAFAAMLPNAPPAVAETIYPWCMQPSAPRGPDCAYTTIEQCRASASAVGFCYQNPAWTVAQGRPDRRR